MKAEEILNTKKAYREYTSYYHKKYIIEAMKEYARIQIEKDRKRIKNEFNKDHPIIAIDDLIDETPIILD